MKKNLPIILLRNTLFLPSSTLKLEVDNEESRNIIDTSTFFHDNLILVATKVGEALPSVGVISKIKKKEKLKNGNEKVIIEGMERAYITNYLTKKSEILETIVQKENPYNIKDEKKYMDSFYHKIEEFVRLSPSESNDLLEPLKKVKSLSQMTDMAADKLIKDPKRKGELLFEFDVLTRLKLLENYIYNEEEKINKLMEEARKKAEKIKEERKRKEWEEKQKEKEEQKEKVLAPIKKRIEREKEKLATLPCTSPEVTICENYIDALSHLPLGKYSEDNLDLSDVKKSLDETHFALDFVKMRILEFLALKQRNKDIRSPILCFVGPPGVGKTTLAFSIAKALKRKFVKISVGGVSDESEFIGHRRTYIGARPGKIITSLRKAKTMNPVFLIDEIDKMIQSEKGDPASTLLEILDPTQNRYFIDHYIEEEIDLSDVLFITTANKEEDIKEELKDRLEIIHIDEYGEEEKVKIAENYLIPKLAKEYNFPTSLLTIDKEALLYIIDAYTKEAGIRELERKLSDIFRKIITEASLNNEEIKKHHITKKRVCEYLPSPIYSLKELPSKKQIGIVNLMAYTSYGGEVVPAEVCNFKGTGNLILTGTLGSVIKESAMIALSYIKSNYLLYDIDYVFLNHSDVHVHIPYLEKEKNGASAGVALTSALISSFTNLKIDSKMAMTGEITLSGEIIEVGKIKEKIMGAYRRGIRIFIIPFGNKEDIKSLPKEIKRKITIYPVEHYDEVYKILKEQKSA